ncbi:hypothetical protein PRIC2_004912 [Phytophthora ramorum]
MLLSAYQQAAQHDATSMRQRRRAIRTLLGVVGAAALLVGCIAAVDVFALNGGAVDTMTLDVSTGDDDAMAMEAQFGWNSIGYGWCSLKSSTWCMFSKDKDKCKGNINCYKNRERKSTSDGSGSGSGSFVNVTVGDSSTDVEVGWDDEPPAESHSEDESSAGASDSKDEAPVGEAPAANPTEPLDLPASGGGEGSKEEADMGGED